MTKNCMKTPSVCFDLESLETRRHLSAVTTRTITNERLLGDLPNVTGIVLTFDGPLDVTSAQRVQSYHLFRRRIIERGEYAEPKVFRFPVEFSSAVYDDTAHTVTLIPSKPFKAQISFRVMLIEGIGANALRTPDGLALGADIYRRFAPTVAKHIRFRDSDRDRIRFDLTGKGTITCLRRADPQRDPIVYLTNTDADSVFTATLIPGTNGDGHIDVLQFNANGVTDQNFTTNSAFSIVTINP
jgi:hypothetical protein